MEETKKRKQLQQLHENKNLKFSDSELDKIYEQYKAVLSPNAQDFAIDMQQGEVLLQQLLGKIQANWWDFVLPKLFKVYDKNQDGKLEFQEFIALLQIVQKGSLAERFSLCFKLCDSDDDNQIEKAELTKLLKVLNRMFVKEDATKDCTDFVDMTWNKLSKKEEDLATLAELHGLIIDTPLLSSYWNL